MQVSGQAWGKAMVGSRFGLWWVAGPLGRCWQATRLRRWGRLASGCWLPDRLLLAVVG